METRSNFKSSLEEIIGLKLLKLTAGDGSGSIINFEFGQALKEVSHANHVFEQGDYSIMIYCSWRIAKESSIITTWKDSNHKSGPMLQGLDALKGLKVTSINLNDLNDLKITFEDTFSLNVFCDLGKNYDFDTNWFFRKDETHFVIDNYFQVVEEK